MLVNLLQSTGEGLASWQRNVFGTIRSCLIWIGPPFYLVLQNHIHVEQQIHVDLWLSLRLGRQKKTSPFAGLLNIKTYMITPQY